MKKILTVVLTVVLGMSGVANATLYDRGNGMVYDSLQNLTWLKDANYAKTSGYADAIDPARFIRESCSIFYA